MAEILNMSCFSCTHFRMDSCFLKYEEWPNADSLDCPGFEYEPGCDEYSNYDVREEDDRAQPD